MTPSARLATDRAAVDATSSLEAALADYDYALPEAQIAQTPLADRDSARLLILDRDTGALVAPERDHTVHALADWLAPGDLLVVNATKVLPARLLGRKASGGLAEALLLGTEPPAPGSARPRYRALVKCTGRLRVGLDLIFEHPSRRALHAEAGNDSLQAHAQPGAGEDSRALAARITALHARGEVTLSFADTDADPYAIGLAPLPPYIRRSGDESAQSDRARYQTVFARVPGAVAAPTAGLHLTQSLLERLAARGVERAEVVLHVGAGTFRPLDEEAWQSGRLHRERFELPEETAAAIARTRAAGGRVVAVGTTTTRVLESCVDASGDVVPGAGETDLFLRPGATFRAIDGLLTNFHLPRSSLLMLVAAMVGRDAVLAAYQAAIARGFRFFSYGDAMLILPRPDPGASRAR